MIQTEELTERKYLCGKRVRTKKNLDMEAIYADFDKGMSWEDVCIKYDASESTIRRHHKAYQEQVKALKNSADGQEKELHIVDELKKIGIDYTLPDLPSDI